MCVLLAAKQETVVGKKTDCQGNHKMSRVHKVGENIYEKKYYSDA